MKNAKVLTLMIIIFAALVASGCAIHGATGIKNKVLFGEVGVETSRTGDTTLVGSVTFKRTPPKKTTKKMKRKMKRRNVKKSAPRDESVQIFGNWK